MEDELGVVHDIQQGEGGRAGRRFDADVVQCGDNIVRWWPLRSSCRRTRSCLRSLTTSMSCVTLTGWRTFTSCCRGSCGMHTSRCIWARHKCGTEQVNALACEEMQRAAVQVDPEARVWKGDVSRPRSGQGLKIRHSSRTTGVRHDQIGPVDCEAQRSFGTHSSSQRFAVRLAAVDFLCATRANFTLRNVQPELALRFYCSG